MKQRWEAASKAGGSHVLRSLMDLPREELDFHYEFPDLLVWFTHTEKLDDFIMSWLRIVTQGERHFARRDYRTDWAVKWSWARTLYGSIISAHVAWSPDGAVDTAIQRLKKDCIENDILNVIGTAGVNTIISKHLQRNTTPPAHVDLFDWWCEQYL